MTLLNKPIIQNENSYLNKKINSSHVNYYLKYLNQ